MSVQIWYGSNIKSQNNKVLKMKMKDFVWCLAFLIYLISIRGPNEHLICTLWALKNEQNVLIKEYLSIASI